MNKKTKQILSLLMSLIMVMSMFAGINVSSFAADDILSYLTWEINNGEVTITDCDTSISGDIVIPDTIEGYPVMHIGDSAFRDCIGLISVDIPNSVKTIEYGVFMDCHALAIINMPDSITSIKHDAFDYTAYYNDTENWEDGVLYVGEYLIEAKSDITSCTVKDGTLVIADGAFNSGGNELISVTLPDSIVRIGSSAFAYSFNLTSINIPNNVKEIGSWAFAYCVNLTKANLPKGITSIKEQTFYVCEKLDNLDIPEGVKDIGMFAFADCVNLTAITIPHSTTNIIDGAFYDCIRLTDITILNSEVEIGSKAFGFTDYEAGASKPIAGAVIYGYADSTAEKYADENGIDFVALEVEEPPVEEPPVEEPPVEEPPVEEPPVEEPPVEEPPTDTPANDGELNVKNEGGIVTDFENKISTIGAGESVDTVSSMIENANFAIVDKNGNVLANDALVGTGSKIQILDNDGNVINEYTVVVPSDIDGNGKTTAADARLALRAGAKIDTLDGVYLIASDANGDGVVTAADARKILRKSAGLEK